MNSQRPALDLDRYRRLKEKARLSHSPRVVSSSSPSVSENQKNDSNKTEPTNKYSPKNISYTTASFSPDPKNTGSRFACGVLSNNNNNHQTPPTSASSLANSESRRRRLDKYTSRTTRQSEPTPCSPKPSIEIQLNEYYYEPRNNHYNYKLGLNYFEKGSVSSYYEEEEGPNDRYDATSGYDKYESTTTTASARTSNIPTAVMAKCRSSGEKERTTTNIPGSPSKLGGGDRRILEKERTTTTRIPGSPSNRGGNRRILMDASPRRSSSSSSTEKQQQQQQHSSRILQLEDPTTAMRRPPVDPPEYRETEPPGTSRRDTSTVKRTIASKKNGTMPTTTLFGSSSSYSSGITPPPAANYFHSASVVEDSSSLEVIPTDEELFRVGWGKALDAKSKCYYYFTHDRTQIVWDNPLAAAGRVRSKKDKDRIEALRAIKSDEDEESREPLVEIDGDSSTLSRLDRVESIRGSSPTNDSLDMRQSLGMPSLSSRYSNENNNKRDSRRRPPGYGSSTGKMMSLGNHDPYRDDPPTTTSQPRGISLSSTSNPSTPKEERDSQKMAKERMHWTEKFRSFRYSSDITPRRSQEGKLLRQMSSPQHSSTATPPKTEANAAPFTFHKNHRKEREASAPFTFHKNRKISSHKAPENNMIQNTERESAASLEEDLPSLSVSIPEPSIKIYRFQSTSPTRPNLDQKTVRLLYSKDFTELIHRHRSTRRRTVGNYLSDQGAKPQFPRPQGVSFVVRKR